MSFMIPEMQASSHLALMFNVSPINTVREVQSVIQRRCTHAHKLIKLKPNPNQKLRSSSMKLVIFVGLFPGADPFPVLPLLASCLLPIS